MNMRNDQYMAFDRITEKVRRGCLNQPCLKHVPYSRNMISLIVSNFHKESSY